MFWSRSISMLLLAGFLFGCGFKPLYGDLGGSAGERNLLGEVEVASISGQPGGERMRALLASDLSDLHGFGTDRSSGQFELEIHLEEAVTPMGIRPDGAATREQYRLSANYSLKDNISGEVVHAGSLSARNTYDVVLSDFSNFSARSDAARRSTREIARALAIRISSILAELRAQVSSSGGAP